MARKKQQSFNRKVATIARKVLHTNTETKTKTQSGDYPMGLSNMNAATNKIDLFAIAVGDDQQTREGNQVRVTYLEYRLRFCLNENVLGVASVSYYPILVRVIEYTPRMNQDDDLSLLNIHSSPDLDKYAIHQDREFALTPGVKPHQMVWRQKYFKNPLRVQYASSTQDDISHNQRKIYWMIDTDSLKSITSNNILSISWNCRIKYKDS